MSETMQYLDRVRDKTQPDSLGVTASEPIVKDDVEQICIRWDDADRSSGWVPVATLEKVGRAIEPDAYDSAAAVCRLFRQWATVPASQVDAARALIALLAAVRDLELWLRQEDRASIGGL